MPKECLSEMYMIDLRNSIELWSDRKIYHLFYNDISAIATIEEDLNCLKIPVSEMPKHIEFLEVAIDSLKSIDDKFIFDNLMDRPDIFIEFYRNWITNIIESAEYVVNALRFPFEHLVELYDNEDDRWIAYEEANFPNQPAGE